MEIGNHALFTPHPYLSIVFSRQFAHPPRSIKNFLGLIIAESTSSIARVSPLFAFPIVPTVCTGLEYFLPIRITRPKKKAGQSRRSRIAEIIRGNLSLGEKFIFKSADRDQV